METVQQNRENCKDNGGGNGGNDGRDLGFIANFPTGERLADLRAFGLNGDDLILYQLLGIHASNEERKAYKTTRGLTREMGLPESSQPTTVRRMGKMQSLGLVEKCERRFKGRTRTAWYVYSPEQVWTGYFTGCWFLLYWNQTDRTHIRCQSVIEADVESPGERCRIVIESDVESSSPSERETERDKREEEKKEILSTSPPDSPLQEENAGRPETGKDHPVTAGETDEVGQDLGEPTSEGDLKRQISYLIRRYDKRLYENRLGDMPGVTYSRCTTGERDKARAALRKLRQDHPEHFGKMGSYIDHFAGKLTGTDVRPPHAHNFFGSEWEEVAFEIEEEEKERQEEEERKRNGFNLYPPFNVMDRVKFMGNGHGDEWREFVLENVAKVVHSPYSHKAGLVVRDEKTVEKFNSRLQKDPDFKEAIMEALSYHYADGPDGKVETGVCSGDRIGMTEEEIDTAIEDHKRRTKGEN